MAQHQEKVEPLEDCTICKDPGSHSGTLRLKNYKSVGLAVLGITGVCVASVYMIATPFLLPAFRKFCLPYVPATKNQVQHVINALRTRTGNVIDLGSGDGRIVLEAAKHGFKAIGVELNPWLVWYSRIQARRAGLHHLASFERNDLWKINYADYSNIVIFGVDKMMPHLEAKLSKELCEKGCIIACRFPLPTWKATSVIGTGVDKVWIYFRPDSIAKKLPTVTTATTTTTTQNLKPITA